MLAITFQDLPEEIVLNILSHVAGPPPSKFLRHQVPSASLFAGPVEQSPLKRASQVCQDWRRIAFPVLFRYVRVDVDQLLQEEEEEDYSRGRQGNDTFFSWAREKELNSVAHSIMLYAKQCLTSKRDAKEMYVDRRNTGEGIHANWERRVTFNIYTALFPRLLHLLEPYRVVVVAPPRTFAQIIAHNIKMNDAWAFDIPYQALEVGFTPETRRSSQPRLGPPTPDALQSEGHLLNIRKWDMVSYNSGSCLNAYGTYHYFEKQPPCIFVNDPSTTTSVTFQHLRHFTYRNVFPHYIHFTSVISAISRLRHLESVSFQLAPAADSGILDDTDMISRGHLRLRDCWMEVERNYTEAIRGLLLAENETGVRKLPQLRKLVSWDCGTETIREDLERLFAIRAIGWRKSNHFAWMLDEEITMVDTAPVDEVTLSTAERNMLERQPGTSWGLPPQLAAE